MKHRDVLNIITMCLLFGLPVLSAFGVLTFAVTHHWIGPVILTGSTILMWFRLMKSHLALAEVRAVRKFLEERGDD